MKVLIAIPTKGRAERIWKDTLSWMLETKYDWKLFIEEQEVSSYLAIIKELASRIVSLPESNQGLGYASLKIKEYAEAHGYDLIFKHDDDLRHWIGETRRVSPGNDAKVFDKIIADCLPEFEKQPDLGAIGFPYRFEMFTVQRWVFLNARLQSCYLIRTKNWQPKRELSCLEDFWAFISLRLQGKFVLRYGLAGQDADVGKLKGGHQLFDRKERIKVELQEVRKYHPGLKAKIVNKPWIIEPDLRNDTLLQGKKL